MDNAIGDTSSNSEGLELQQSSEGSFDIAKNEPALRPRAERHISLMQVVTIGMIAAICLLGVCHAVNYYITDCEIVIPGGGYFHRFFDLNQEQNIPAWYASILWFMVFQLSALNFALEWRIKSAAPHRWVWLFFALLFLAASADEVATIHEHVGSFLQDFVVPNIRSFIASFFIRQGYGAESFVVHFSTSRSPWVLFYAPFLLAAGGFCWLFLWRRFAPYRKLRILMLAAAACYVVAESFDFIQGMRSPPVTLIPSPLGLSWPVFLDMTVMVEELLEDLGTVCIILALAKYLQTVVRAALIGPVVIEDNALQQADAASES
jgi:hypothetical protein